MSDDETIARLRAERNALKARLHSVLVFLRGYSPHAASHFADVFELIGLSPRLDVDAAGQPLGGEALRYRQEGVDR